MVAVRRGATLLMLVLASCRFDASGLDGTSTHDAAIAPIDGDLPLDATTTRFCTIDPDLVGCYRFEVAGDAVQPHDDSSYANSGSASNGTYPAGTSGTSMAFDATSATLIPDSASLDVAQITLEVWVLLDSLPDPSGSGRVAVLDNNGQYGMFIASTGAVRCSIGTSTDIGLVIPVGVWTHVACTYDGATVTLYQDGVPGPTISTTIAIPTAGIDGLAFGQNLPSGDNLDGAIDDLRIWRVPRTAGQIAADAAL
jgi:hypothetical protein